MNDRLKTIVNLEKYPIQNLNSTKIKRLIKKCKNDLDQFSCSTIPNFILPRSLEKMNLELEIIFSLPLITIFVDKKNFKQNPDQWPIILPPKSTILLGNIKDGKKTIEITTIPKKKNIENKKFLIILF